MYYLVPRQREQFGVVVINCLLCYHFIWDQLWLYVAPELKWVGDPCSSLIGDREATEQQGSPFLIWHSDVWSHRCGEELNQIASKETLSSVEHTPVCAPHNWLTDEEAGKEAMSNSSASPLKGECVLLLGCWIPLGSQLHLWNVFVCCTLLRGSHTEVARFVVSPMEEVKPISGHIVLKCSTNPVECKCEIGI